MIPQGGIGYTRWHLHYWRPLTITVNGETVAVYNLHEYGHISGNMGWRVYAEVNGTRIWRQDTGYYGLQEYKAERWTDEQRREAGLEGR